LSLIFRYGISLGRVERDPTRDLTGILPAAEVVHHPAILDVSELAGLLRALDGYQGTPIVTAAARLLPLIFCRPGEMLTMCWADIDPARAQWVWVAAKTRTQMITPLSRQAMQILAGLKPITGEGRFVLPSLRAKDKPLSNTAIKGALDSLGFRGRMTSHGWRAVARTHLVETLDYPVDIVEMQLAHNVRDALGRAYNRTTFMDQRREMMQRWADWLDEVRLTPAPASASPGDGVDPWAQWSAG
jgi:integrase